jgi:murein L,D-transpeptidase YcbB/YkuD
LKLSGIFWLSVLVVTLTFLSCQDEPYNPNKYLTLEQFAAMDTAAYRVNSHRIREEIGKLCSEDKDSMTADYRTRSYYLQAGGFLWIDRHGADDRADTLLTYLNTVERMGFSKSQFRVSQIERDLQRIRTLAVDRGENQINKVLARLEYNLTKAYLRYATGQRFGFVNPRYVFNRLDVLEQDSQHVSYRGLFDIKMEHGGKLFYAKALRKIRTDSVGVFLHECQPSSPLYRRFLTMLNDESVPLNMKPKILVNMERCRWRLYDYPRQHAKYVLVNIPSFHLRAIDGDEELEMRIGCGSTETKTPLLTSYIKRMDINPQWIVPRSIIKNSMMRHAGNAFYFQSNHYFARNRKTGETLPPERISWNVLNDDNFLIIQEGGEHNSLGRIIFRFDNSFSVYLHDTNSRGVFSREERGVSHGCVRVERPFDLAVFLFNDRNDKRIDKVRYSMSADVSSLGVSGRRKRTEEIPDTLNRSMLIGSVEVTPKIPVFITYFTLYPDKEDKIQEYADVYGYDSVIYRELNNYR